jgi:AhpD family alkylhydroperoxidase
METREFLDKFTKDIEKMKAQSGPAVTGFGGLFAKTMADGAIPVREKELIALGIAVAVQCVPCIRLHVQKCLAAGATREQVIEAAGVAVMMGGGPAYTHLPIVLDALDALNQ